MDTKSGGTWHVHSVVHEWQFLFIRVYYYVPVGITHIPVHCGMSSSGANSPARIKCPRLKHLKIASCRTDAHNTNWRKHLITSCTVYTQEFLVPVLQTPDTCFTILRIPGPSGTRAPFIAFPVMLTRSTCASIFTNRRCTAGEETQWEQMRNGSFTSLRRCLTAEAPPLGRTKNSPFLPQARQEWLENSWRHCMTRECVHRVYKEIAFKFV